MVYSAPEHIASCCYHLESITTGSLLFVGVYWETVWRVVACTAHQVFWHLLWRSVASGFGCGAEVSYEWRQEQQCCCSRHCSSYEQHHLQVVGVAHRDGQGNALCSLRRE